MALMLEVGCVDADEPSAVTTTTAGELSATSASPMLTPATVAVPAAPLLAAADLGADFQDVPFTPDHGTGCSLGDRPEPASHVTAAAVSNARQQYVFQEVLTYASAAEAEGAFSAVSAGASCPAEGNLADAHGVPQPMIVGESGQGFAVEYIDEVSAFGFVVVRVDRHLAIVGVKLRHGGTTVGVLGSNVIAASLVRRLA